MKNILIELIDFVKVETLLEGFNKSTGFVTAILDLEGKVLSKSGWRQICDDFHRGNPETSKKCTISDTELAGEINEGDKYHFYKCLNGLVDVVLPIVVNGEHIANLFSGQFFFEEPDKKFFKEQARKYGFEEKKYIEALEKVPIFSKEKVLAAMEFLQNMTQLISETIFQKIEQIELNKSLKESEERFALIIDAAEQGIWDWNIETNEVFYSEQWKKQIGYNDDELKNEFNTWVEHLHPDEKENCQQAVYSYLKNPFEHFVLEFRFRHKDGTYRWIHNKASSLKNKEGKVIRMFGIHTDITERKLAEDELKRIEWLLTSIPQVPDVPKYDNIPPYGDLVKLNTNRLIFKSVGEQILTDIVSDYLNLLDTSSAIYEKNGDYALGIFSSGWCRFMDAASREICETNDNSKALNCGQWHCHESCWSRASKVAIETRQAVDVECEGGIRLYALPIQIGEEVIGAINFGYGDPPRDEETLRKLASKYSVNYSELLAHSLNYEARPPYIIELAKQRLKASARLIGEITKRKQAEEALRRSEEMMLNSQSVAHICSYSTTINELELEKSQWVCSPEFYKIFGIDETYPHTIAGWSGFIHPDHRDELVAYHEYVIKNRISFSHEYKIIRIKDGVERWVHGTGELEFDKQGKPIRMYGAIQDITERKYAEVKLSDSEVRYLNLLTNLEAGIVVHAPDTSILMNNPKASELLGLSDDQMKGKVAIDPAWKFVNEYHIPLSIQEYPVNKIAFSKKPIKKMILGILNAGSDIVWVTVNGFPVLDNKDEIIEIVISFIDITERKLVEDELKYSEEKFREMADLLPQIIFESDINGNLTYVNNNAFKIFGYPADFPILGKSSIDFYTPDSKIKAIENIKQKLTNNESNRSNEYVMVKNDGSTFPALVYSNPIIKEGKVVGLRGIIINISELKQAEEALRKSEENLSITLHSIGDGVISTDIYGLIVNMNPIAEKLCGWKLSEVIGKPLHQVFKIINADTRQAVSDPVKKVLVHGEIVGLANHTVLISRDGNEYQISDSAAPIKNKEGVIVGVVLVFSDVTDKYEAEIALKESEARFKALHNASFGGIVIHDKGKIIECNQGLSDITGYSYDELVGMDGLMLIAPDTRDLVLNNILTGYEKAYEAVGLRKNGEMFPLRLEARNVPYKGKAVRTVEFRDVTERKQTEYEIEMMNALNADMNRGMSLDNLIGKAKMLINNTFSANHTTIYVISDDNKYLTINNNEVKKEYLTTFEKLFSIKIPQEIKLSLNGDNWYSNVINEGKIRITESSADIVSMIKAFIESNYPSIPFKQYLSKSINFFKDIKCIVSVPLIIDKQIFGLLDINLKSKPTERDIERIGKFAEQLLVIINRKKAEEELYKAKEKAEESDRLKSAFLANMSHEIRTPMNGILGFSELLKEPNLSGEEQLEYIQIIEKSGQRMLNIINDIIDISKIEAGLMKLNVSESNINEQIEYIYTFFKPEVDAKRMKFSFKTTLSSKEATIKTDREKVYAILTNLVKNAIKYSHDGSIEFGYDLIKNDEYALNPEIQFYVKDSGIGIPNNRQEAIFERFIQADISDKMARQGAGLGLAISRAYVVMLGGKIWVESEVGKGSTFYFTLPYHLDVKQSHDFDNHVHLTKDAQVKKLKLLIAEDDDISEKLISMTIYDYCKDILVAKNGHEAVEICRANPDINLILMDIQMPDLNGYEATRQIREFNKSVIIIAQTAYGLSGDREKAMEAGCNDYLAKPIKKEELLVLIQNYLWGKH